MFALSCLSMKINRLLILILPAILNLQCKKDEIAPKDVLLHKSWKKTIADKNLYSNPPGKILYATVLTCQKDDIYKFNEDGKLILQKGSAKCQQIEASSESISYSYNSATKELIIGGTNYTLAEASEDQIKYYTALPAGSGSDYLVFLLE